MLPHCLLLILLLSVCKLQATTQEAQSVPPKEIYRERTLSLETECRNLFVPLLDALMERNPQECNSTSRSIGESKNEIFLQAFMAFL